MNTNSTRRIAHQIRAMGCIVSGCANADVSGRSATWIESMIHMAHLPETDKYRDSKGCPVNPGRLARTNADAFLAEMWLIVPMCAGCHAEADREGMHHAEMVAAAERLATIFQRLVAGEA